MIVCRDGAGLNLILKWLCSSVDSNAEGTSDETR
jgi:hypothetical protein